MQSVLIALLFQHCLFAAAANNVSSARRAQKPHIIVAMVDDLGWSSVGFNLESPQDFWEAKNRPQTPNIDKLAKGGVVLSSHYAGKMCAPSRSSFISGRLPIHVNQHNHEIDQPGTGVPLGMSTIAEMLKTEGYSTHHIGKWHLGLSSPDYLPTSRGFDSSLALLGGSADHFMLNSEAHPNLVDLWLNNGPAGDDMRPTRLDTVDGCTKYSDAGEPWDADAGKPEETGLCKTFSQDTYMKFAKDIIDNHDINVPMFMFLSLQMPHGPLQVPNVFLDMYAEEMWKSRRYAYAMISSVDEAIKDLKAALDAKGMWDNTLLLFTSDNGGPREHEANYPLRGSKATDFEGGVRVSSFLAGGFLKSELPVQRLGKSLLGTIHICDWWSTFAGLAGHSETSRMVDPRSKDDATHGREIPARVKRVDSLDMWPYISGAASSSPRTNSPTVLSAGDTTMSGEKKMNGGMIWGQYKLVVGPQLDGTIPGPSTPDERDIFEWEGPWLPANEGKIQFPMDCGPGCLFNLAFDPGEKSDLRYSMAHRKTLKRMEDKFKELTSDMFQAHSLEGVDGEIARTEARDKHNHFWGPWQEKLPENAWAGIKLNGAIIERISGLAAASACKEGCANFEHEEASETQTELSKPGDACMAWSFWGVTASKAQSDRAPESNCTLFKRFYPNNPTTGVTSITESPHVISGVMKLSDLPAAADPDDLADTNKNLPEALRQRRRRNAPAMRRRRHPKGQQRRRRRRRNAPTMVPDLGPDAL